MGKITRDPLGAENKRYDLIVIGGGIYGIMLTFEASKRGLSSLLLERADFGGATTFNCLRILHGGFRYLQTMDIHRLRESVAERRWFMGTFPELVKPLPCLMPLYGNGLRRPLILQIATWINDALSYKRNEGVLLDKKLPDSQVINAEQTKRISPSIDLQGLQGGLIWYDAYMPDSQFIVMELLRWSCENGGTALNYVEAHQLLKTKTSVKGVIATNLEDGKTHEYKASVVVNAAGPWCRDLAACFDRDEPNLFKGLIAWNVLLNRDALSSHALAVAPKKPRAQTYFLLPWKGKLLAGTGQATWFESAEKPMPKAEMLQEFLDDLNLALPSLKLNHRDILYVFAGLLPATKFGSSDLAVREVILNHAHHGGPRGFYSISGVKFTTARLVAEKTLKLIFPERQVTEQTLHKHLSPLRDTMERCGIFDFDWFPPPEDEKWKEGLRLLIQEEAVEHLDDLIYRRTSLWQNPEIALEVARDICQVLKWDQSRCRHEMARLEALLSRNEL